MSSLTTSRKSTPGGKRFDQLNEFLVKPGGSELAKTTAGLAFSGTIALLFGWISNLIEEDARLCHPVLFQVIGMLLVMAFNLCATAACVYKNNWPRVSAVTGVIGTVCAFVLPPITTTIFLSGIFLAMVWTCFAVCFVLICGATWWPAATPDLPKEDANAITSSSQAESGSFTASQSGETRSEASTKDTYMDV